jgi:hypothetical protein
VKHHVDPWKALIVIADSQGEFISGWRLNPTQLERVLLFRKLGGG